jgi:hypothetical protein
MRLAALAIGAAGFAAAAAPASAEPGRLADFGLRLSSTAPGTPTGTTVHILLHRENDPDAKPSPLRTAVLKLPDGLRFDSTAVPICTATDDELRALGSDACPEETKLTVGEFSAILGFGPPFDPLKGDDHVFNGDNQLIEVITAPDASASPAFDRLTIDGSTLTAHPPKAPGGPPDGESSVRSLDFEIPVRAADGKSLITTPPACPASGRWTTSATFGFADGSRDTVASVTPCKQAAPPSRRPGLRLRVSPRHVRAGEPRRFSFRVRSASATCVAGSKIRFGGLSVRTGARGGASITASFTRPGVKRAFVSKPGCRRSRARIRVLAAR